MPREPRRPAPKPAAPASRRHALSPWSWLRNSFFAGIAAATPVAVTIWIVSTLIHIVDRTVRPLIPPGYHDSVVFAAPGADLLAAAIALTLLGALTANIVGRSLLQLGERVVARVPVVRETYSLVKQVVATVFASNRKAFEQAVLVEYPRPGLWSMGFLSAPARQGAAEEHDYVEVFLPKSPISTLGFVIWSRRSDVHVLNMSVEQAAKLVISAGIVSAEVQRAGNDDLGGDGGGRAKI
jgi:uncharacterized membrane protein